MILGYAREMTENPIVSDILAQIAKDPQKLVEVLKAMDADGNKTINAAEIVTWVTKNIDQLVIEDHNLAEDFRTKGASALSYPQLEKDRANPNGPEMTKEFIAKWGAARNDFALLQNEIQAVAAVVQDASMQSAMTLQEQESVLQKAPAQTLPEKEDPADKANDELSIDTLKRLGMDDVAAIYQEKDLRKQQDMAVAMLKKSDRPEDRALAATYEEMFKSAREQEQMEAAEKAKSRIPVEDPRIVAIRQEAAKYKVEDIGSLDVSQLSPIVNAATAAGKSSAPQR